MTAKSANMALENMTRGLNRTTFPRLPPAPGCEGSEEFVEQVNLWMKWIAWEKEDPLVLKDDEPENFSKRILHCYKQALMALRFWPDAWVEAAEWCLKNGAKETGVEFLTRGIEANPESVLLALKNADRIEASGEPDSPDLSLAEAVRIQHARVLDTLYEMVKDLKVKEQTEISGIEKAAATVTRHTEDEDDRDTQQPGPNPEDTIKAVKQVYAARTLILSKTISHVWIALARAMRRIQGKGAVNVGGLRQVFTDARARGKLTSDVYVAVAQIESVVYKDPVGAKIFERGAKLFPEDEAYHLEYIKFLHSRDDTTSESRFPQPIPTAVSLANVITTLDARVVFETCVNRLTQNPATLHKAKPLYAYFHTYESRFGELSQIAKLEDRMAELFPEDPKLSHFSSRFSTEKFDPVATRIIVSPAVQLRPKIVLPSVERAVSVANTPAPQPRLDASPRPHFIRATNSPKRPFAGDDEEFNRPRKLARGESPLKGAAGRRLDQSRRNQPSTFHREITFLLNLLPPSSSYDAFQFNSAALTNLIRTAQIPDYATWKTAQDQALRQNSGAAGSRPSGASRPTASEYSSYGTYNQDGAQSPYDIAGRRVTSAQGGFRGHRPGSSGNFEPPAANQYNTGGTSADNTQAWHQGIAGGYSTQQQQYGRYPY
jgi:cleavage stimulation factor subunit 3